MDLTATYQAERPRLLRIAERVLGNPAEAEDVVQQAWLRLHATPTEIENLPAWLTTVTTRLCLDRLRLQIPQPAEEVNQPGTQADPADELALAEAVGVALRIVLNQLTPRERVAFVLHESFSVDFPTIAEILDTTPVAARKLASRARNKVAQPAAEDHQPDWAVVDAFLTAARGGDFTRLVELLAPDVIIAGDSDAVALGTPTRIAGREPVATFFNGAARAALPASIGGRPGAAWFQRGTAKVAFDFTVENGVVQRIDFRASPDLLAQVTTR